MVHGNRVMNIPQKRRYHDISSTNHTVYCQPSQPVRQPQHLIVVGGRDVVIPYTQNTHTHTACTPPTSRTHTNGVHTHTHTQTACTYTQHTRRAHPPPHTHTVHTPPHTYTTHTHSGGSRKNERGGSKLTSSESWGSIKFTEVDEDHHVVGGWVVSTQLVFTLFTITVQSVLIINIGTNKCRE